jgi:hypothetical protein
MMKYNEISIEYNEISIEYIWNIDGIYIKY